MVEEEWDSDLTDLTDDDGEYLTKQSQRAKVKKSRKNRGEDGVYQIQNALKVPRATTYTAQSLYEQIQQADIDLDPEYQRAVVWPESKQVGLIDSIFRNFYIPPVIFAVKTYEDGTEARTCIDGKQRLTSIHRFMSGHIPHRDPITKETLWYQDVDSTGGKRKKVILPEKYRTLFANKQVVCVEYSDIGDLDERDIFQRVQLGMALSPSEKLQVISSPKANFIRELVMEKLDCDSPLVQNLKWDRARGNDFRFVAQSIFIMDKWRNGVGGVRVKAGDIPKGSESAGQMEKYLNGREKYSEDFQKRILLAYDKWRMIAGNTKLRNLIMQCGKDEGDVKLAPIEFAGSAVLIERHQDSMSPEQLAQNIHDMRAALREDFEDIRANSKICKAMLMYTLKIHSASSKVSEPSSSASTSRKRSRPSQSISTQDDEEVEESSTRKRTRSVSSRVAMKSSLSSPPKRTVASASTPASDDSRRRRSQLPEKDKDEDGDTEMLAPSISSNRKSTSRKEKGSSSIPNGDSSSTKTSTTSRMQGIRAAKAKAQAQKEYYSSLQQQDPNSISMAPATNGTEVTLPKGFTPEMISHLLKSGPLPPAFTEALRQSLDASAESGANTDGVQPKSVEPVGSS